MSDIPARQPGEILDPGLFEAARRRWPGGVVTTEMALDVARLEGRSPYIPGSTEAVNRGVAALAAAERRRAAQAAGARVMAELEKRYGPPKPKE